jgi:peptidoglycan/LPS O-acetylase OafA/YrhL
VAWVARRPAAHDPIRAWSGPRGAFLALPLVVACGILFSLPERMLAPGNIAYVGLSHVVVAACGALVIVRLQAGRVPVVSRLLEAHWLVPVAKLSYSLYLVHPIVYGALGDVFVAQALPPTTVNVGTLMVISVVGAFACAAMLYVFVEKPIMDRRG